MAVGWTGGAAGLAAAPAGSDWMAVKSAVICALRLVMLSWRSSILPRYWLLVDTMVAVDGSKSLNENVVLLDHLFFSQQFTCS